MTLTVSIAEEFMWLPSHDQTYAKPALGKDFIISRQRLTMRSFEHEASPLYGFLFSGDVEASLDAVQQFGLLQGEIMPEHLSQIKATGPEGFQMIAQMVSKSLEEFYQPYSEILADTFALAFTDNIDASSRSFRPDGGSPSVVDFEYRSFRRAATQLSVREVESGYFRLNMVRAYLGQTYQLLPKPSPSARRCFARWVNDGIRDFALNEKEVQANSTNEF